MLCKNLEPEGFYRLELEYKRLRATSFEAAVVFFTRSRLDVTAGREIIAS
jgi:hypothetical protein